MLFVWWNGHVDPQTIGLGATINVLIIAVIGGLRRIEGAFVGALAFVFINDRLAETDFSVAGFKLGTFNSLIGLIFLAIVLVSPDGLLGLWERAMSLRLHGAGRPLRPPPATNSTLPSRRPNLPGIVPTDTKEDPNVNLSRLRKLKYALPLAALVMALTATATTAKPTVGGGTPIKIAILSDCKGAFAAFYGADVGGAIQAFVEQTGAKVEGQEQSDQGHDGRQHRRPSHQARRHRLLQRLRRPRHQRDQAADGEAGADILIGPLSGDESIAVAKYAKAHPTKTFVNGTSGALDTTMIVRAPNFFRWNGDGAQWNAGTGWVAYNVLGWRKVNVIMDDYSFGWTSAAGFIAEFCALGGEVTKRVFPPLNTTDYSSYVAQLDPPNQTDGYFWAVGGTGTLGALKAFEQKYGNINSKQHMGNLFFGTPGTFTDLGLRIAGSYAGGGGTVGDVPSAALAKFRRSRARPGTSCRRSRARRPSPASATCSSSTTTSTPRA